MVNEIELQILKTEYLQSLNRFSLPSEQEQFTAMPKDMLEVTHERHPIVILSNSEPVGFFVLHSSERVKEYTDNLNALLLTAFSINYKHQGKGYAKKGLQQIDQLVKRLYPKCNEIVLAVNHKNISAQKVYEKAGYQDTGRRKIGRLGEQFIMSYPISFGR
jgi:RimJ/RimL family protein N-acetyltransferase